MEIIIFLFLKLSCGLKHFFVNLMDFFCSNLLTTQFRACGEDVKIYHPFTVTGVNRLELGNNVHINRNAFIRAEGGLFIGHNVHISRNLTLYTINHNYTGENLPYDESFIHKPVIIRNNVWIGINVTIIPGVTIGEGAIIGAGTVVSRDVPPLAIVGSYPQRIIRYRDSEHYQKLIELERFGGMGGKLYCQKR